MSKKPTLGQKMEAMIVLGCAVWLVIGVVNDVLSLIIRYWQITFPLSILLIWWYYFRNGENK